MRRRLAGGDPPGRGLARAAGVLARALLVAWGAATLVFLLVELAPGDAADRFVAPDAPPEVRAAAVARWGLDRPAPERYLALLGGLLHGDLGVSPSRGRPVAELLAEALPNTLLLAGTTLVVVFSAGIAIGVVQAARRGRAADRALAAITLLLYAVPEFWLAVLLVLVFSVRLGWLPATGGRDPLAPAGGLRGALDVLRHLLLPGVALGVAHSAAVARHVRSSMLEALGADFVLAARARGLPEHRVLLGHALRAALLPTVALAGLSVPYVVGGSVVVETVFAWPGMGRLVAEAATARDAPLLVGAVTAIGLVAALATAAADAVAARLDPRTREDEA